MEGIIKEPIGCGLVQSFNYEDEPSMMDMLTNKSEAFEIKNYPAADSLQAALKDQIKNEIRLPQSIIED